MAKINSVKSFKEAYKKFAKTHEVSDELESLVDVTCKSIEQIDTLKKVKSIMKGYTLIQMISNTERLITRMAETFEKEFGIVTVSNAKREQMAEMNKARSILKLDEGTNGDGKMLEMYNREMAKAKANPLLVKQIQVEKLFGLIDKKRIDEITDKLNKMMEEEQKKDV